MNDILQKLGAGQDLNPALVTAVMEELMSGHLKEDETAQFLSLLRQKGETPSEILAAALVMRKYALKTSKPYPEAVDTCGTGGDGSQTLNVSTLSAIVTAAAGSKVVKHGNRSVSSVCGSADLLEMLGVRIDLPVDRLEKCLEETDFAFFFAPNFHPATKHAMAARKKIGGKTLFNLLGPLSNPAGTKRQLMGVYDLRWVQPVAQVLKDLGSKRALVVHGNGMDEISTLGETYCAELQNGEIRTYSLEPENFGIKTSLGSELRCDSQEKAKGMALRVLEGRPGPAQDLVALNAGAALFVADRVPSIAKGVDLARKTLADGLAMKKLNQISRFS